MESVGVSEEEAEEEDGGEDREEIGSSPRIRTLLLNDLDEEAHEEDHKRKHDLGEEAEESEADESAPVGLNESSHDAGLSPVLCCFVYLLIPFGF